VGIAALMLIGVVGRTALAQAALGDASGPVPSKMMAADADPVFEVATIKPSQPNDPTDGFHTRGRHLFIENQTVNKLVAFAYGMNGKQILGGPAWLESDRFDIDGVPDIDGTPSLKQEQGMVKRLLADRFGVTLHKEKKELSVYAITVGKSGPKLTKSIGELIGLPSGIRPTDGHLFRVDRARVTFSRMSAAFAVQMTGFGF
jgi:uncharacterized protein (TIGR03435 family)